MQRRFEEFNCGNCHEAVVPLPTGTRNHCNHCLHSAHMDAVEPGDRASECRGLMEPIGLELRHGAYVILHRCTDCGHERKNKSVVDDSIEAIMALAQMSANGVLSKHNRNTINRATSHAMPSVRRRKR